MGTQPLVRATAPCERVSQDLGEVPCGLDFTVEAVTGGGVTAAFASILASLLVLFGDALSNGRVTSVQRAAIIPLHSVHRSLYSTTTPRKLPLKIGSSLCGAAPLVERCSVLVQRSQLISTTTLRPMCPPSILGTVSCLRDITQLPRKIGSD